MANKEDYEKQIHYLELLKGHSSIFQPEIKEAIIKAQALMIAFKDRKFKSPQGRKEIQMMEKIKMQQELYESMKVWDLKAITQWRNENILKKVS